MRNVLILGIVISFIVSCTNTSKITPPNDVIKRDTLITLLVDIHLADATLNTVDLIKKHHITPAGYYNLVFEKYGYTRANFDSTLSYYSNHPKEYKDIYEEVLVRLIQLSDPDNANNVNNPFNKEIKDTISLNFFLDYENNNAQSPFDKDISNAKSYNGSKSLLIKKGRAYGPTFSHKLSFQPKKISVNFTCYMMLVDDLLQKPSLTISIEGEKELLLSNTDSLDFIFTEANRWEKITYQRTFNCPKVDENNKFTFFLWNIPKKNIYIDDLSLTLKFHADEAK